LSALLINLNLAWKNPAWAPARRALLWTAGIPLLGLAGFIVHMIIFLIPLGDDAYGPRHAVEPGRHRYFLLAPAQRAAADRFEIENDARESNPTREQIYMPDPHGSKSLHNRNESLNP